MNRKRIVIIFMCVLIGSCVFPITARNAEKTPVTLQGNWLYVGGSGPGNYTRIQDAVDNATNGDTIFVFDDSSPYVENVRVDVSLSLVGEKKETTVIDGANRSHGVNVTAENVMITGFTIQNCTGAGVYLASKFTCVTDNILTGNFNGIMMDTENISATISRTVGNNTIMNNQIIRNGGGIFGLCGWNNTVQGNIISENEMGIIAGAAANTNISLNHFSENLFGIFVLMSYGTVIYQNNISYNRLGVWMEITSTDNIIQNNFIGNNQSALAKQGFLDRFKILEQGYHLPIHRNIWRGNYWDEPRSLPYMIPAGVIVKFGLKFDWHPAQEPYDIPRIG